MFAFLTQLLLPRELCFIDFDNNELARGTTLIQRTIVSCWFVTPSQKKNDENGNRFVDDEPFIDKRKPSSMMVAKGVLNNGEHTLIPITAKMIHSAVWDLERFVLKDGRLFHMVKLVGAVRNFRGILNTYKLMWKMAPDLCG